MLFDMDGVVMDSRPGVEHAWRGGARQYGIDISDEEMVAYIHGQPGTLTMNTLFSHLSEQDRKTMFAEVCRLEDEYDFQLIPGIRDFLRQAGEMGIQVGLVTSAGPERINRNFSRHDLHQYFQHIVSIADVSNGKPHPEPYLTGMARFSASHAQTVVFEDSVSGVRSAVDAGAFCIGIGADGDQLQSLGAAHICPDFQTICIEKDLLMDTGTNEVLLRFQHPEI